MHNIHNDTKIYDFVFIGIGASNSLLLLNLIQKNCNENNSFAIIESNSKVENDKTYCFWSHSNSSIVRELSPIISHSYSVINVNQTDSQKIDEQPYYYIRSSDLYNHTKEKANQHNIAVHRDHVEHVSAGNEFYTIKTSNSVFFTRFIFDSRAPSLSNLNSKEIYIHQSFYGLHIKCKNDVFDKHAFNMMNFNIEQSNYTQFIYILPFSNNEALVELTRFGVDKIDTNYAKGILDKFLSQSFGDYEILGHETGCIPMTTFQNSGSVLDGVLNTGANANMIKPSTGYGFKKMFEYAEVVSDKIVSGDLKHFNKMPIQSKSRFLFYDRLLLTILLFWPNEGKKIFTRLFKRHNISTIFQFLDEKTSLYQEIKIFMSLPIIPFLKALFVYIKTRNHLRYIVAVLFVILYLITVKIDVSLGLFVNYSTLVSGLLLVGIPHGALDYLLIKKQNKSLVSFIIKYLLIIAAYLVIWCFFPMISLIIFLVFSCFHFGESEIVENGSSINSTTSVLNAFFLGLSVLCFIIFNHITESLSIISNMIDLTDISISEIRLNAILLAALSLAYIILQSFFSRKRMHWGLLFLLLMGSLVPLIAAFGLYFIVQHSSNAWEHLKNGLSTNSISLYKKALPFTMGAVLLFMIIAMLNNNLLFENDKIISSFFIFLACISLPHVFLMHNFYESKN